MWPVLRETNSVGGNHLARPGLPDRGSCLPCSTLSPETTCRRRTYTSCCRRLLYSIVPVHYQLHCISRGGFISENQYAYWESSLSNGLCYVHGGWLPNTCVYTYMLLPKTCKTKGICTLWAEDCLQQYKGRGEGTCVVCSTNLSPSHALAVLPVQLFHVMAETWQKCFLLLFGFKIFIYGQT